MLANARTMITSGSATNGEVVDAIRTTYERYRIIIDPHTACAMHVALQKRVPTQTMVVVETALPAKFPDTINEAIGLKPPVPEALARLEGLPEYTTLIEPDLSVLKSYITAHLQPVH